MRLLERIGDGPQGTHNRLAKVWGGLRVLGMQSHELLREVLQKTGAKKVAADLNLSLSMIYKWAEPQDNASGATNPLDRIEGLLRCTNDHRLVQWICQRAGGFYIKNPKTNNAHPEFLIPATNEIIQEFADLLGVIAAAVADNQITPREADDIRDRWEELKSVTEGFVQCCEHGNFRPLKDGPHAAKVTLPRPSKESPGGGPTV
jgi:hypothetical protein